MPNTLAASDCDNGVQPVCQPFNRRVMTAPYAVRVWPFPVTLIIRTLTYQRRPTQPRGGFLFDDRPRCRELTDLAYAATQRHIEVLTRLQTAIVNRKGDLIEALEFEAQEAGHARAEITETYRHHLRTHRHASAGSAA